MGKKTITGTKNVYELAQERLKVIFNEFDNIYVSFSGGKDSGVLLNMCIDYIRRNNLKIRLGVFHMDYEIQYKMTIDYVDRILEANKDILDVYRVCVPFRVSTCTSMYQSFWRPWEDNKKDIWVRSMPKKAMKKEDFPFYNTTMWDYEFQMRFAQWLHQKKDAVRTCCLIGIRTQESFNRWRCIYMSRKFQMYHKYRWTSKVGNDIYNAYPIFDWKINEVVRPINAQDGDLLPVSAFKGIEDGTWHQGTAQYEKRGVAAFVPEWNAENCIQCNKCAYVCPHASIRPFVLDAEEQKGAQFETLKAVGKQFDGMTFRIQVDVLDCLGCGNCADVCPGNPKKGGKALTMKHLEGQLPQAANWEYCSKNVKSKQHLVDIKANVKNSQFATPLFEFSGACSGCGETPYVKLISQLFGDREMVANATGCSSIYSGSVPSTPYTTNEKGQGPAWANSLFEDFCEFGLGMTLADKKLRARIEAAMKNAIASDTCPAEYKEAFQEWIDGKDDADKSKAAAEKIIPMVEAAKDKCENCATIAEFKNYLVKKSQWIIGGDGASYDIGYGGLDHVIASGEDVNILVLDTEVYSNTGGQSSKATPLGAIAKFAASGKRVRKKDLGMIATTYGYVYVAQIAMGADQAQTLKAIREAEAYPGPSLVIAYAPCINHGLKAGMGKSQAEEAKAVECGYWHLWRFNPALEEEGKNPFMLDSKEPKWEEFQDYLKGEVRFASVAKQYPAEAADLFAACEEMAKKRYASYQRMAAMNWGE